MIRKFDPRDRVSIEKILNSIPLFSKEEVEVALELIDEVIFNPHSDNYYIFVHETGEAVNGYYCIGKRSLTNGVFDLYWIAVNPENHNKGFGKQLLTHAENFALENQGKLMWVETSSKENYYSTRKFYLTNQYNVLAEIKDFYSPGNNLVIFGKYLIK